MITICHSEYVFDAYHITIFYMIEKLQKIEKEEEEESLNVQKRKLQFG